MGAEKLSISLDSELAEAVRAAADDEAVSVSTWLARAAEARVRSGRLREALDAFADVHGGLVEADIDALVRDVRARSIVTGRGRRDRST
jgi:hypothetical protein